MMPSFSRSLKDMRLFLFDIDGTLLNGKEKVSGTVKCQKVIAEMGANFCILTNNSSRTRQECQDVLARFGCNVPEENIYTAGDITAHYIESHWPGSSVYVVGTTALEEACRERGLTVTNDDPKQRPEIVLVGLDQTLTYDKLSIACSHLLAGARYLATHPDITCPTGNGQVIPDIGCTLSFIKAATGLKPLVLGKPNPYVLSVVRQRHDIPLHQIAMVGDRLATDIALGVYGNIATVLVCSGVTSLAEYEQSPYKTEHVFSHVGDLAKALQGTGERL